MMISKFDGEYSFLSNFHPCTVNYEDINYPSVEHAYQAAKTLDFTHRNFIAKLKFPGQAKREGRLVELRTNWDHIKLGVMKELLHQKFSDPELLANLKSTAPNQLVEGNTWGDTYWGVCNGKGKNHLGNLLMTIRDSVNK